MSATNRVCICEHARSDHDDQPNPKCQALIYPEPGEEWRPWPCDCPGFEADPKANGDNE